MAVLGGLGLTAVLLTLFPNALPALDALGRFVSQTPVAALLLCAAGFHFWNGKPPEGP